MVNLYPKQKIQQASAREVEYQKKLDERRLIQETESLQSSLSDMTALARDCLNVLNNELNGDRQIRRGKHHELFMRFHLIIGTDINSEDKR